MSEFRWLVPEGLYVSLTALRRVVAWTFPYGERRSRLLAYLSRILEDGELEVVPEFKAYLDSEIDKDSNEMEASSASGN